MDGCTPLDDGMSMDEARMDDDAAALKRPRLVWTPLLHKRDQTLCFVDVT